MIGFRNFTLPLWQIFGGNLLLLATLAFYIAWWTVAFRPNANGKAAGAGLLLLGVACVLGMAAITVLSQGINALAGPETGPAVGFILGGALVSFFLLVAITVFAFQRVLTSELFLIIIWAALEAAVLAVLQGSGRFSLGQAGILAALVGVAMIVGLVCYVLHYRLDEVARFWNGLIPLVVDAGVVAVFLVVQAFA
jgi:hypothetical protein